MDIDKNELNRTIQMLMRHMHDSQTSIGRVIGLSQPQVGFRLRAPDDPKQIDWSFEELRAVAKHWAIPFTTLCSGRAAALQWATDNVIDVREQPSRGLSWNADGQLDLFSSDALAADVRAGGALWEFSDRTSVDTLTNAEDEVSSRERQLVA